jgi:hypothetical protein
LLRRSAPRNDIIALAKAPELGPLRPAFGDHRVGDDAPD